MTTLTDRELDTILEQIRTGQLDFETITGTPLWGQERTT